MKQAFDNENEDPSVEKYLVQNGEGAKSGEAYSLYSLLLKSEKWEGVDYDKLVSRVSDMLVNLMSSFSHGKKLVLYMGYPDSDQFASEGLLAETFFLKYLWDYAEDASGEQKLERVNLSEAEVMNLLHEFMKKSVLVRTPEDYLAGWNFGNWNSRAVIDDLKSEDVIALIRTDETPRDYREVEAVLKAVPEKPVIILDHHEPRTQEDWDNAENLIGLMDKYDNFVYLNSTLFRQVQIREEDGKKVIASSVHPKYDKCATQIAMDVFKKVVSEYFKEEDYKSVMERFAFEGSDMPAWTAAFLLGVYGDRRISSSDLKKLSLYSKVRTVRSLKAGGENALPGLVWQLWNDVENSVYTGHIEETMEAILKISVIGKMDYHRIGKNLGDRTMKDFHFYARVGNLIKDTLKGMAEKAVIGSTAYVCMDAENRLKFEDYSEGYPDSVVKFAKENFSTVKNLKLPQRILANIYGVELGIVSSYEIRENSKKERLKIAYVSARRKGDNYSVGEVLGALRNVLQAYLGVPRDLVSGGGHDTAGGLDVPVEYGGKTISLENIARLYDYLRKHVHYRQVASSLDPERDRAGLLKVWEMALIDEYSKSRAAITDMLEKIIS